MIAFRPIPGSPLSLLPHLPERSSPPRVRSAESFQTRKRFSSAAQKPRALDRSGPFRKRILIEGKGGNCKGSTANPIPRIRPPPLDDVNILQASLLVPAPLASTAYSLRRNVLFTSPESAHALV